MQAGTQRSCADRKRANARARLPVEVRQKLLGAIYDGRPFRGILRDLGLTSNQLWGLTKTDQEWSKNLEAALTATRRDDLEHGTNAAYVRGCACSDCRKHQHIRMLGIAASRLVRGRFHQWRP